MFKQNENYEVDRRILICDYIRCSTAESSTINTPNNQIYIKIPKDVSFFSLLKSYFDYNLKLSKKLIILDMQTVMV